MNCLLGLALGFAWCASARPASLPRAAFCISPLAGAFARAVEKDRPDGLARAVFFDVLGATDRAFVTFPRRGPPSPAELEEIWAKAAETYAAVRAAALDFANELTLSAEFAGTDWAPLLAGLWDPDCGQLAVACLRTRQFAPLRAKLLASIAPA